MLTPQGVELVLYFLTLQGLFRRGSHNSAKSRRFFTIYSTVLLLLLTVDISVNAVWGEQMWITNQANVPGFIVAETSVWYQTLGSTSVVALIFMGDALLVCKGLCSSYYRLNNVGCPTVVSTLHNLRLELLCNRPPCARVFGCIL